jgi:hypothetical protein
MTTTVLGNSGHQHHKNLRRHLDMGVQQPQNTGGNGSGANTSHSGAGGPLDGNSGGGLIGNVATANLFEIKKRSIDFFQHVSALKFNIRSCAPIFKSIF